TNSSEHCGARHQLSDNRLWNGIVRLQITVSTTNPVDPLLSPTLRAFAKRGVRQQMSQISLRLLTQGFWRVLDDTPLASKSFRHVRVPADRRVAGPVGIV